jgi:hypothetical protein
MTHRLTDLYQGGEGMRIFIKPLVVRCYAPNAPVHTSRLTDLHIHCLGWGLLSVHAQSQPSGLIKRKCWLPPGRHICKVTVPAGSLINIRITNIFGSSRKTVIISPVQSTVSIDQLKIKSIYSFNFSLPKIQNNLQLYSCCINTRNICIFPNAFYIKPILQVPNLCKHIAPQNLLKINNILLSKLNQKRINIDQVKHCYRIKRSLIKSTFSNDDIRLSAE